MTRRASAALAVALAACSGDRAPPPSPGSAAAPTTAAGPRPLEVTAACRAAITALPTTALDARVAVLLDACQVCGPWTPLLDWHRPPAQGGPTRAAIEQAAVACDAFCEPNAKQRFLGTLDEARGGPTRTPWRLLGETCKAAVSAVPDTRYASAALFALDRVARAVTAAGGPEAAALAAIDLPLPALSISGVGVTLPRAPDAAPTAPTLQLTVMGNETRLGVLPRARLTDHGAEVNDGAKTYPGAVVLLADASAAPLTDDVVVLAPAQLPAVKLVAALGHVRMAPGKRLLLGEGIYGPDGWELVGTHPVALTDPQPAGAPRELSLPLATPLPEGLAGAAVRVTALPGATVTDLSDLLTKLHAQGVKQIALQSGPAAAR